MNQQAVYDRMRKLLGMKGIVVSRPDKGWNVTAIGMGNGKIKALVVEDCAPDEIEKSAQAVAATIEAAFEAIH